MGFSRGTEIFDEVAKKAIHTTTNVFHRKDIVFPILEQLYDALRDADWDDFDSSEFADEYWFKNIQKRLGYDHEEE